MTDHDETLTLQHKNAKVWRRARDPLDAMCHGDEHGTAIVMSGGAVLGARWGHTLSDDVDVHLRRIADFTILRSEREHGARLDTLMRDAGGKRLMTEEIQIKYGFKDGELDLIAGNLFPTRYGTSAEVEGREAEVASTAQIIATKIRARGRRAPARDLFDIAVAEREDPEGCKAGVNAIPAQELRDIEAIWRRSGEALAEEAKTIIEPSARYNDITADPAGAACATIDRLIWRTITLQYAENGATLIGERGATRARRAGRKDHDRGRTRRRDHQARSLRRSDVVTLRASGQMDEDRTRTRRSSDPGRTRQDGGARARPRPRTDKRAERDHGHKRSRTADTHRAGAQRATKP